MSCAKPCSNCETDTTPCRANAAQNSPINRPNLAPPAYPDPLAPEQPASNQKSLMIAAVAVGAGLMVVGLGLAIGGRAAAQPAPTTVVAPPSMFEEQRQMMKEAMQMAKDAQQAQQQHREKMEKMMREETEGPH